MKEKAVNSLLLCNAVIYHSMGTVCVNHLLSLACWRTLNSGKCVWNESKVKFCVHGDGDKDVQWECPVVEMYTCVWIPTAIQTGANCFYL